MHTILVIGSGLVLLLLFLAVAKLVMTTEAATIANVVKVFIPVWLLISIGNMWFGMTSAGYTFMEELPILIPVFGVPAATALAIWYFWRA